MPFLQELKRRRVVRVAIGYAIGAWVLVQVADILLPTVDAPDWLFRAIVAVAFLGFPLTVVLAWVFDISGKRVVVTDGKGFTLSIWVKSLLAIPLIALVSVSGWWVWSGYVAEKEVSVRPTDFADRVPIVAVMPIRNVTGDLDLDWYSEALAHLIRDNLTRSKYLRVVSPLKWQNITGDTADAAEWAELASAGGIGFILGGEMLSTPEGISVTSRLIDIEGGVSLSARQMKSLTPESLLTAANPIASQVRQALNVPREEQVDVFAADFATNNLAAYESYVAGLGFFLNYQYEQAAQAFETALELAPDFVVARYRLAHILAVAGETDLAIRHIEQALRAEHLPDREQRYIEAAGAYFRRDYEKAIELYESLIKEYPFEIEARQLLADCYWDHYRPEEAVHEMQRLSVEEPYIQEVWSRLGSWLMQTGQLESAQVALERFANLAPENPNSYTMLGDSLRYRGMFEAAMEQYHKALAIDPQMREVANSLGTIHYLKGNRYQAAEDFRLIAFNEDLFIRERLDAVFPLASLQAARGNFSAAAETLEGFVDLLKDEQVREAMALARRALYELEMGHEASTWELVNRAIRLSPGLPTRYLFARGIIELRTEQYDRASATALEIMSHALPPKNPDRTEEKAAAYLNGLALMELGRLDEARGQLERATQLEGYSYSIYELGLARLMLLQGETDKALALVAESTAPDFIEPRLDLEVERTLSILLRSEIQRNAGDVETASQSARAFLGLFDQVEVAHPAAVLARDILSEASLAE